MYAGYRVPILIVVFGILLRLPLVFSAQTYGFQHTSWRQTDTASIAHNFLDSDSNLFYPQIHWRGNGPGYVETELQLYPFIVALLYRLFGEHVWLGGLVSLGFTVGTFIVFYRLARRHFAPNVAQTALLFLVISPLYVRYSTAFMPEAAVLFFYVTALHFFVQWLDEQSLQKLVLSAGSTALAILVKPTSVHIGFIFLLLLIEKYRFGFFRKPQVWLFAFISLFPGVLWYFHARELYLDYGNTFGILSGGDNKFDNLRYWFQPGFYLALIRIDLTWLFAVGGVLPFLIGLILSIKQRAPLLIIGVVTIFVYYMLVPRYTSFAEYYHIYALPFVALSVGAGMAWLFENLNRMPVWGSIRSSYRLLLGITVWLLISGFALRVYLNDVTVQPTILWSCSQYVRQLVPEESLVIISTTSVANDNGIPNNYQEPDIFFYSHRYGWSLPKDWHSPQQVDAYRQQGAGYLVMYDQSLYESSPALADYLETNGDQIGPGVGANCGIYRFNVAARSLNGQRAFHSDESLNISWMEDESPGSDLLPRWIMS